MKEKDFTLVVDAIAEGLEIFGAPLSQKQRDIMAGTVGLFLLKIEDEGLQALLTNLRLRKLKRPNASGKPTTQAAKPL